MDTIDQYKVPGLKYDGKVWQGSSGVEDTTKYELAGRLMSEPLESLVADPNFKPEDVYNTLGEVDRKSSLAPLFLLRTIGVGLAQPDLSQTTAILAKGRDDPGSKTRGAASGRDRGEVMVPFLHGR